MEIQKLLGEGKVGRRLQGCLRASEFNPLSLRALFGGAFLGLTMADVALYYQLKTSIDYGQLPWYTTDILIITIGALEAVSAPFWSWFGHRRVRSMMLTVIFLILSCFILLGLPSVPMGTGTVFCSRMPTGRTGTSFANGMTTAAGLRLAIIIVVAVANAAAKAALWNHTVVLLDQTDPSSMTLNYGITVAARCLVGLVAPKFINDEMPLWMQAVAPVGSLLVNVFQLYRMPEPKEVDGDKETSFTASLRGVFSSGPAVGIIFAMALLVAPLWGYLWHDSDVIKMLFYTMDDTNFVTTQSVFLYYHVVIVLAVLYGIYYDRPPVFNKASAMKLATFASILAAPLYCVQTLLLTCETGLVAGLDTSFEVYNQPTCSTNCQCTFPYSSYSPVCVTDGLVTYMSPCHAGCTGEESVGGLTVYRNCTCAPSAGLQNAVVGACSSVQCRSAFTLHKVVTVCIVIFTLLALQAQLVTLLRLVGPRDRAMAIGVASALALFAAFGGTHLAFLGVRAWTCAWFEDGQCRLYTPAFLKAIGGTSTGLAGLSAAISLGTWLVIGRRAVVVKEDIAMTSRRNSADA